MKFEYDVKEERDCVAKLFKFNGGPELCLAVKAQSGKFVWLYHNEILASVQSRSESFDNDDGLVRKFHPGDKITITF